MTFARKTVWLIGASEGLGRELARSLHAEGAQLVLSARNVDRLESLRDSLPGSQILPLDVADPDAARAAARYMTKADAVIYNAGTYQPMRATEWDADAVNRMLRVNLGGALDVLGEITPRFVARGYGDITLVGSLAGYRGLPAAVGYGASKAALISLAETMRHDLKGTGVTVRIVNPGFIRTRLTDMNGFRMPMLMTPQNAAGRVLRAMRSRRFRTDFPAPFSWLMRALLAVPDILFFRDR